MYRIRKEYMFHAMHSLPLLPEGHKCRRPHGHTYTVTLFLCDSTLDEFGFVADYSEMSPFQGIIDEQLDHRNLNEVLEALPATTVEHIAYWLYRQAQEIFGDQVERVRVSESPHTWGEYYEVKGWRLSKKRPDVR